MDEYRIRKVTPDDFSFLADAIIWAEKGNSGKCSYAALLGLEEDSVKRLIISMLNENIDGCEFSPSSYLVADYKGLPVAAVCAWIEAFNGNLPSRILKSNLMSFFLKKKQIQSLTSKFHIISDIVIERERMTSQAEYMYVARAHRGRGLHVRLANEHLANALSICPGISKAQVHVFENNFVAIRVFEEIGFKKIRLYTSSNIEIFNYLPYNTKLLMEKDLTHIAHAKD